MTNSISEDYLALVYDGTYSQRAGQYEQAIGDFSQIVETEFSNSSSSKFLLLERARSYMAIECYSETIRDCNRILEEDHHEYQALLMRGYCHFRKGKFDAALSDLSEAIQLKHTSYTAYLWRGLVYRALGKEKLAQSDLNRYTTLYPKGVLAALSYMTQAMLPAQQYWLPV